MSAINFPDPSQSPWTNSSTGITYTYSNGVWKALSSEETFLKTTDAESTYLKQTDAGTTYLRQTDANFVSLNDGGTQQVISGGGGLNIDGDVQKKGNTVPSAVMGTSAPSNPGICDFWTDTSGADPVLKSWNGTEWVEVGSSGASEFAPVISNVTLTENDPTGDRFTSQTFDVDITMLREGEPFSQKGLKGEVTASFEQRPSTEPVASNSTVAFPNNSRTYNQGGWYTQGYQVVPVWAPGITEGTYEWYTYHFPSGNGSNGSFITIDINNIAGSKAVVKSSITLSGATEQKYGKYYPATDNNPYEYIWYWNQVNAGWKKFYASRRTDVAGASWYANWTGQSRPWYDEATGNYYWTEGSYVYRGDSSATNYVARSTSIGSYSNYGTNEIAVGNGIALVLKYQNSHQYALGYDLNFADYAGYTSLSAFGPSGRYATWMGFVNNYFYVSFSDSSLYRSSNGSSWTNVSIPRTDTGSGQYRVWYMDTDPNTGVVRAWSIGAITSGASTTRNIFTSNNNGATWVATWGSATGASFFNECIPLFGDGKVVFVDEGDNGGNKLGCDYYPYGAQTITLQGTGEGYSEFNVGDLIRKAGTTGYEYEGTITSISGTTIGLNSPYTYQAGDVIEAKYPTSSGVSTRYLIIEASGNVTGTVGADPGYVSVGPDTNKTLTFPATFPSGNAPDSELPAGTTFKVSAQATNSIGSSEFGPSNIITPA